MVQIRKQLRRTRSKFRSGVQAFTGIFIGVFMPSVWKETRCLFVLSTGRTGTATLQAILDASDEIDAFHEPQPQLRKERKLARTELELKPRLFRRIFIRARGKALLTAHRRGTLYAETSARLTFFAPVIARLLPGARFVFIHRHPAAVIRSGMRRGWYVDHPADKDRIIPVKDESAFNLWKAWDPFTKICWYWNAYIESSLRHIELLGSDRVLTIQAKTLFDGSAIPAIFKLIDVTVPQSNVIEELLTENLNAQKQHDYPDLQDWTIEQKYTLDKIARASMERLGYPSLFQSKDAFQGVKN